MIKLLIQETANDDSRTYLAPFSISLLNTMSLLEWFFWILQTPIVLLLIKTFGTRSGRRDDIEIGKSFRSGNIVPFGLNIFRGYFRLGVSRESETLGWHAIFQLLQSCRMKGEPSGRSRTSNRWGNVRKSLGNTSVGE